MMKVFKKMMTAAGAVACAAALFAAPVRADEMGDAYLESLRISAEASADARDSEAAQGLANGLMYLVSIDMSTLQSMIARDAQLSDELERSYVYLKDLNEALAESREEEILKEASYIDSIDMATASAIVSREFKAVSDSISGMRYLLSIDAQLDPASAEEDLLLIDDLSGIVDAVQSLVSSMLSES